MENIHVPVSPGEVLDKINAGLQKVLDAGKDEELKDKWLR